MSKNKGGAKGKYQEWLTEEGLVKLEGLARDGLTDEQIANNIGIRRETLYAWKNKFPNISNALKRGKEVVDREVENALFKSALGYEYEELTREVNENGLLKTTKVVTKQVAPNPTSAIFWLKNRKPNEWRDKKETELSGGVNVNNPFKDLTTDELRKLARSDKYAK